MFPTDRYHPSNTVHWQEELKVFFFCFFAIFSPSVHVIWSILSSVHFVPSSTDIIALLHQCIISLHGVQLLCITGYIFQLTAISSIPTCFTFIQLCFLTYPLLLHSGVKLHQSNCLLILACFYKYAMCIFYCSSLALYEPHYSLLHA